MRLRLPDTRGARACVAAFVLLALVAPLLLAPNTAASTADVWRAKFVRDSDRLHAMQHDLSRTSRDITVSRANYKRAARAYRSRIAAIYKAGGVRGIDALIKGGGNVRVAGDRMEAMRVVAQHDALIVHRYRELADRIPELERRERSLRKRIAATKRRVAIAEREIRKAEAAAAAARIAAARAAMMPDSPLAISELSPESVQGGIAASAAGGSSGGGPTGYTESGEASIYSNSFTGELTANGERYNPGAMTAAHKTLPLGSWVQVRGPGGSTALVRINDRGPFIGGRIIDLSPAAAAAAGVNGLGYVTIRVVG